MLAINMETPKFKMQYYLQSVKKKKESTGVPTVAQWVKNPTAVAQVGSLAWHSGLKDPGLLPLRLGFSPWPRNFHMPWVQP